MNAEFLMLLDGIGEDWLDTTEEKRMYISFKFSFFRETGKRKKNTYSLSSAGVNPAKPTSYTLNLFNFVTELGIILVDVKRE